MTHQKICQLRRAFGFDVAGGEATANFGQRKKKQAQLRGTAALVAGNDAPGESD